MPRVLAVVLLLATGCGAKTGLRELPTPRFDGGVPMRDAPVRDVPPGIDAPLCTRDAECDDSFSCTEDACADGVCLHVGRPAFCDDGVFCNGAESCNPAGPGADVRGCVPGAPIGCADAVACTVDGCDEERGACVFTPDVNLCPVSFRCDPVRGCLARALAHDPGTLYEIDLPSGDLSRLAALPVSLTDIALHPDGTLYGAATGTLWRVDYEAGTAVEVASVGGTFNALDFSPTGLLYGASDDRVVQIDLVTGTITEVASFPPRLSTSGDLGFVGGRLFATATADHFGTTPDVLIEIDLATGTSRIINSIGQRCIWGLAPLGDTLFGLTCEGLLLRIDTTTARAEVLRTGSAEFYGAGAR